MKSRCLFQQTHHVAFAVAVVLPTWTGTAGAVDPAATSLAYASAEGLGVLRTVVQGSDNDHGMVSIDFDVPRYGPLCISVEEGDDLKFAWSEFHNLYRFADESSFTNCDFSNAEASVSRGFPQPNGIFFFGEDPVIAAEENNNTNTNNTSYFACSKICARNGHKVMVCRGGSFGETNDCYLSTECTTERKLDVRRIATTDASEEQPLSPPAPASEEQPSPPPAPSYIPVGRVCQPTDGDGYSITTGIDTPESCRERCDEDANCGAWEFRNYSMYTPECELHEANVVSFEETLSTGFCEITTDAEDYQCCWIKLQTETTSDNLEDSSSAPSSSAPSSSAPSPSAFISFFSNFVF